MGILRAIGKYVVSIILCLCISFAILSISFAQITSDSFMKPLVKDIISSQANSSSIASQYSFALDACKGKESINFPIEAGTVVLNCSDVKAAGKDGFVGVFADSVFNKFYYSNCSGLNCLKSTAGLPGFLTSGFNLFLKRIQIYFIAIALIFGILLLLLAKGIPSKFISLGSCFISSGIPYIILPYAMKNVNMKGFESIASKIISAISQNFLVVLVTGIVLLIIGTTIKFIPKGKAKKKEKKDS